MKTTIEFNVPEDREEFEMCMAAPRMQTALYDIYQYLRQNTKYAPDDWSEDRRVAFEEMQQEFNRILVEHEVDCV